MKADDLLDGLEHIDPQLVHQADTPSSSASCCGRGAGP